MQDGVESETAEQARECCMARQIALHEFRLGRNGGAVPLLKVVEYNNVVPARNQLRDAVAADEAGAAGDQNGFLMRHVKLLIDFAWKTPETAGHAQSRSGGGFGVS
jgi:hypothetical protein